MPGLPCCSGWWRLLAPAESRWVPPDGQRWRLLPFLPYMLRHVRPLPHNLRLQPHQDTQTESKEHSGKGGETSQRPAAEAAAATNEETPRHHQGHQPAACCGRWQTSKTGLRAKQGLVERHQNSLDLALDSMFENIFIWAEQVGNNLLFF